VRGGWLENGRRDGTQPLYGPNIGSGCGGVLVGSFLAEEQWGMRRRVWQVRSGTRGVCLYLPRSTDEGRVGGRILGGAARPEDNGVGVD